MLDVNAVVLTRAFPSTLHVPVHRIATLLSTDVTSPISRDRFGVDIGGERVDIPYRIHFAPLTWHAMGQVTVQKQIEHCLFTRSMDGFVRQKALRQVLSINQPWSIPFVVALVGEYVWEIIDDIHREYETIDKGILRTFLIENPTYLRLVRALVQSYFHCYHQRRFWRRDYCGFAILASFDALIEPQRKKPD